NFSERRVMNGPHHPCHILERMFFESPFAERESRFPFKVDYDEVFSRKQHLAQVVVTMYPRLHCANACFVNLTEALEDIIFKAQYAVGDRACFRTQSGKSMPQQIETLA